uniref:Uncharacterized protein n=1 Tax=Anopheles atroparvus TaxID=41427 RepID=A0A182ISY1_ANOAO
MEQLFQSPARWKALSEMDRRIMTFPELFTLVMMVVGLGLSFMLLAFMWCTLAAVIAPAMAEPPFSAHSAPSVVSLGVRYFARCWYTCLMRSMLARDAMAWFTIGSG